MEYEIVKCIACNKNTNAACKGCGICPNCDPFPSHLVLLCKTCTDILPLVGLNASALTPQVLDFMKKFMGNLPSPDLQVFYGVDFNELPSKKDMNHNSPHPPVQCSQDSCWCHKSRWYKDRPAPDLPVELTPEDLEPDNILTLAKLEEMLAKIKKPSEGN